MEIDTQKIKVRFDNSIINHAFFSYLDEPNRLEILTRLQNKISAVCAFTNEAGDILFATVFDFGEGYLHVREVAGFFGRYYHVLDMFAQGFAKFQGYDVITFNASHRSIAKWAEKMGYHRDVEPNEFIKRMT